MNNRVNEVRKSLKLNMNDFGSRLGVTAAAISRIESGERAVTDGMAKLISKEFHIRESWLRTGEGEMYDLPEDETAALVAELLDSPDDDFYQEVLAFVKAYQELDAKDKEAIKRFIKRKNSIKEGRE